MRLSYQTVCVKIEFTSVNIYRLGFTVSISLLWGYSERIGSTVPNYKQSVFQEPGGAQSKALWNLNSWTPYPLQQTSRISTTRNQGSWWHWGEHWDGRKGRWCGQSQSPAPGWCDILPASSLLVVALLSGCYAAFTMVVVPIHPVLPSSVFVLCIFDHIFDYLLCPFAIISSVVFKVMDLIVLLATYNNYFEC